MRVQRHPSAVDLSGQCHDLGARQTQHRRRRATEHARGDLGAVNHPILGVEGNHTIAEDIQESRALADGVHAGSLPASASSTRRRNCVGETGLVSTAYIPSERAATAVFA